MGKTFRRNDYRRPKKDKFGQKSRKQRDFEEEKFNYRPQVATNSPPIPDEPDL
jgi:hypothetical protein